MVSLMHRSQYGKVLVTVADDLQLVLDQFATVERQYCMSVTKGT